MECQYHDYLEKYLAVFLGADQRQIYNNGSKIRRYHIFSPALLVHIAFLCVIDRKIQIPLEALVDSDLQTGG